MSEAVLQQALQQVERTPSDARSWRDLARAFLTARRAPAAVEAGRQALQLDPQAAPGWTIYGLALRASGNQLSGRQALERASELSPRDATCWGNLATAHEALGELEAAVECASRAVAVSPDKAAWHAVLGTALRADGQLDAAIAAYNRAELLSPDDPRIAWNRALAQLAAHDFVRGLPAYESRRQRAEHKHLPTPLWTHGSPPPTGVLVHCEQGFGDTLQWARFLPRLARQTRRVVVAAPGRLMAMLRSVQGVSDVVGKASARAKTALTDHGCAAHVGLMSLGALLAEDGSTLAHDLPLWTPSRQQVAPYSSAPKRRIAICWQGNPAYERDHLRSPPLKQFESIVARAAAAGISVVSLQKVHGLDQLEQATGALATVTDLGAVLDNGSAAFIDTAAAMSAADLVITSDTATAHLAGSLPTQTWLLLSRPADWRWGHDPESTPWYPRMRVFRQPTAGDWNSLFRNVDCALSAWIGAL